MRTISTRVVVIIGILTSTLTTQGSSKPTPNQIQNSLSRFALIQGESISSGNVAEDKRAIGGRYAHQKGDYQPIIIVNTPSNLGDPLIVWVHYRGVGVQLKGIQADGSQKELQWLYESPRRFTWASFGTYQRSQISGGIVIIRAPGGNVECGIDAVVFAAEPNFDPNRSIPAPASPGISVRVDWNKDVSAVTKLSYGLNAFHAFDPANAMDLAYRKNLAYMNSRLVRLHNAGMMTDSKANHDGWLNASTHTWDVPKITAALRTEYPPDSALMINIPGWPSWMETNSDGMLDLNRLDEYARMCAELVKIVIVDLKKNVVFWEITNEKDGAYYAQFHNDGGRGALKDSTKLDRVGDLVDIYNRCARAMKQVAPHIKTGGPALARPDFLDFAQRFIQGVSANLDFFTYHAYASGSRSDSDDHIFDRAAVCGEFAHSIRSILAASVPQRHIPLFMDEYNISWTWETRDTRMTDNKSAVFDALAIAAAIRSGADGTAAWNDKDGIYGKMDGADHLRPSAHLFSMLNSYGVGQCVQATTDDTLSIVAYAVRSDHYYGLWIINRSDLPQSVSVTSANWKPKTTEPLKFQVAAGGLTGGTEKCVPLGQLRVKVPADSVTLYLFSR